MVHLIFDFLCKSSIDDIASTIKGPDEEEDFGYFLLCSNPHGQPLYLKCIIALISSSIYPFSLLHWDCMKVSGQSKAIFHSI